MPMLSPDEWREISSVLDLALGMGADERAVWIARVRDENPGIADRLQALLDVQAVLASERFLERSPAPLIGSLSAGQTVGAYTLVAPIGEGGMSTVWLAGRSDGRFRGRTAVKFLNVARLGRGGHERFLREGTILGRLQHPHIAHLMDAGVTGSGQPYLVLEHVEGEHIDRYCDHHRLGVQARVELFVDVLSAVAHAHANLIVHRDIKPSNVLVAANGQVKLLDFGIAKLIEDQLSAVPPTQLTRDAGAALTPQYAAPEQLTGQPVSTATDVYSLGGLLYTLLTGHSPAGAPGQSYADLVRTIVDVDPPAMSAVAIGAETAAARGTTPDKLRQALGGDLDTIAAKALQKHPPARYLSVTALADDLHRWRRHDPISARRDTRAYRAAKFVRRNRTAVALSALAALTAIAGLVGTLVQAQTARRQRDFAVRQLARAEQINSLNHFLLTDAAPSGTAVTVNDLLATAERVVEHENYADNGAARVEALISIGMQYADSDENGRSLTVLQQAYEYSRELDDPSVRARAACSLAIPVMQGAQRERAESLIQDGLDSLPTGAEFVFDRAVCLVRASEVALLIGGAGTAEQAITRARSAQQALNDSPVQSGSLKLEILTNLASAYHAAGRFQDALAAYAQAVSAMDDLGYAGTRTAQALLHDWGLETILAGRPSEGERIYRQALDISRTNQGDEVAAAGLLNDYAGVLRELGRLQEAIGYAERASAKAAKESQQLILVSSLFQRERIYRELHDLARAKGMLAEIDPMLRRTFPTGHYAFASAASERALLALAEGDLSSALQLSDLAVSIDEAAIKSGGAGEYLLPTLLVRRSSVELEAGQIDRAVADATRALSLLQQPTHSGGRSANIGRAFMALGRALDAQGQTADAREAGRSAVEHLNDTLGPDNAETLAARQLAAVASK
jgi:eukaryotic-like serine/threonine-protein kinase